MRPMLRGRKIKFLILLLLTAYTAVMYALMKLFRKVRA